MQAIEAKRAKEKEQEKVTQKLSKAEKKKQEFEKKMKEKVFDARYFTHNIPYYQYISEY